MKWQVDYSSIAKFYVRKSTYGYLGYQSHASWSHVFVFRLLWRWCECNHCLHSMLSAREDEV